MDYWCGFVLGSKSICTFLGNQVETLKRMEEEKGFCIHLHRDQKRKESSAGPDTDKTKKKYKCHWARIDPVKWFLCLLIILISLRNSDVFEGAEIENAEENNIFCHFSLCFSIPRLLGMKPRCLHSPTWQSSHFQTFQRQTSGLLYAHTRTLTRKMEQ